MKKSFFRACSVAVLLLLLWNPPLACKGAGSGLSLWAQVVLPTLLPFMICSNVIVTLNAVRLLTCPFRPVLRLLRLSPMGSYVLMSGLLCGYPMGAKTCSDFLDEGRITQAEGRYLLAVCNHPSPMFLLGYVLSMAAGRLSPARLLLSIYLPVLPLAMLARRRYGITGAGPESNPVPADPAKGRASFDDMMMGSFAVMVKIGGYIMIFSILAAYIAALPYGGQALKAALLGLVEITTGIQAIASYVPPPVSSLLLTAATAFGGLSGVFQTKSVIKNAGLSIRHYILWKALHCALSSLTFAALAVLAPAL